ncbi:hypothetical protein LTR74_002312 [Friedmanniomyces endolithicus]|nr:hypothetical protein LTR74_002312 [Friedmanniomyces endolithicus]
MLDPLTAFTLAAAIISFVDFAKELCSDGYHMYKTGKDLSASNADIEERLLSIQDLEASVKASAANTYPGLSKQELKLQTLAQECQALNKDLLVVLDDLKVTSHGLRRAVAAVRQSIRSFQKAREVRTMMDKLDQLHLDVNTCLLLVTRDDQSTAMRHLSSLAHTAAALEINSAQRFAQAKSELLGAVERQDNELRRIAAKVDHLQPAIVIASSEAKADSKLLSAKLEAVLVEHRTLTRHLHVLQSLQYPSIFDRQTSIPSTYGATGHWIFDPRKAFFDWWLQHGHGIFWVCGKAGSGKSTLMKFLSKELRTVHGSRLKTSEMPVTVVSFFFWNAGTELQRSQEGLLQSLLFQILRKCPDLIPFACSERWAQMDDLQPFEEPWTGVEVRQALDRIVSKEDLRRNFFILIDGLDEYAGDHHALIVDLERLSTSPFVKMCVSSRPWNPFLDAFGADPMKCTVVESNTKEDIESYVNGILLADLRFLLLSQRDFKARRIAGEIRERSQGVFLWVFLAVRSLLRGLGEHDDVETLLVRLQALPPELERLFEKILGSVESVYRQHQAEVLLLSVCAVEQLPTLAVWHLRQEARDPGFALRCQIYSLNSEQLKHVQAEARQLVNSWCRDLLEVHTIPFRPSAVTLGSLKKADPSTADRIFSVRVSTLHRTVRDYLASKDVEQMLSARAGPGFDPLATICYLYLAQITVLDPNFNRPGNVQGFFDTCHELLRHACELELKGKRPPMEVLSRLDELGGEMKSFSSFRGCHWSKIGTTEEQQKYLPEVDFVAYTVSYGLIGCIEEALARDPEYLRNSQISYLYFALRQPWVYRPWGKGKIFEDETVSGLEARDRFHYAAEPPFTTLPRSGIVRFLLRNGSDPNEVSQRRRPSRPKRSRREEIQHDESLSDGEGSIMDRRTDGSDDDEVPSKHRWERGYDACRHHNHPMLGKHESVTDLLRKAGPAAARAEFVAIVTSVEAEKVALTAWQSSSEPTIPPDFHGTSLWEISISALGFPLWAQTFIKQSMHLVR